MDMARKFWFDAKEEGIEEGRIEGFKEGLNEGTNRTLQRVARNLLILEQPIKLIAKATGLLSSDIEKINSINWRI